MGVTCEECRDPGACCRAIPISQRFPVDMSREHVAMYTAEGMDAFTGVVNAEPMPMMKPLRIVSRISKRGAHKPHMVTWLFECENLTPEGRCGNYDNRPKMCRVFEPGSSTLCVEYTGSLRGRLHIDDD